MASSHVYEAQQAGLFGADVLLVTATSIERRTVLEMVRERYARDAKAHPIGAITYSDLGEIGGARTVLVRCGMGSGGSRGSTLTVAEALATLNPGAAVMVGIAFGVNERKQSIGDILVSENIRAYDLKRVGTKRSKLSPWRNTFDVILRGDRPAASPHLLDRFEYGADTWDGAKVRLGLLLSGDKLVDNIDYRKELQRFEPEAIGGEMEAAGLYAAAYRGRLDWIVVKAICDWADGQKHVEKKKHQALAARNAVEFVFHVFEDANLQNLHGPRPYTPPHLPDPDELPPPGPLPPGSRLRFHRNQLFTGREQDLFDLAGSLLLAHNPATVITQTLAGMGGVGKTQLAVEFAHRYGRFFHGVHWLNCQQPDLVAAEVAACGEKMKLRPWPSD